MRMRPRTVGRYERIKSTYAGARTVRESATTAIDANTQSKLHEVHKRHLQRLVPLEDECIEKVEIAMRPGLIFEDDLTNKKTELDATVTMIE